MDLANGQERNSSFEKMA